MRISDWSSDVCSSDLSGGVLRHDIQILQISSSPRGAFSRSEFLNFIGHCREIAADARKSLILANPGAVWTKKKRPALRENRPTSLLGEGDRKSTRMNSSH